MKMISVLMLVLITASALTLGCIGSPHPITPTITPAPTILSTPTATLIPTWTPTPVPQSTVYMPEQTTNGRSYPTATIPPNNGSKPGGIANGELGNQN